MDNYTRAARPQQNQNSSVPPASKSILTAEDRTNLERWLTGNLAQIRPPAVTLDPTSACPFRCPGCIERHFMSHAKGKEIDFVRLQALAAELRALGTRFIAFYGGDPLAYSRIGELLGLLAQKKFQMGIVTNGYLLRAEAAEVLFDIKDAVDWVRVSINAGTEATHTKFHCPPRSCFELIIAQVYALVKRGVKIGFSYVVNEMNASEIAACARRCLEIGAEELQVKPFTDPTTKMVLPLAPGIANIVRQQIDEARMLNSQSFKVLVASTLEYALRNDNAGQPNQELKSYSSCPVSPFRMVISPPGRIICCPYFRGSPYHTIGTLDRPLNRDWLLERFHTLRRINPQLECKFPCNRHLLNEALNNWRLRYERGEDVRDQPPIDKHSNPYWL